MRSVLIGGLAALLTGGSALAATPVVKREVGALVTENVPETPPAVREQLHRYQNTRSANFLDWLGDGTMLIATRFGQTPQIHHVKAPGGDRTQLTFFDEPVTSAAAQPMVPGAFVLARDTGGDEYFQGYASAVEGGEALVTDPKTRNTGFVFSPDGTLLAWSRVTPGKGDYDIMLMRTGQPATRRVALKGKGAVGPAAFSADGGRILFRRAISAQSSKVFVLETATGRVTEINPSRKLIAYSGGEFTPDGRRVLMLSDEKSEVARLVEYDLVSGRKTVVADGGAWEIEAFDLSENGRLLAYAINQDGRSRVVVADIMTRRALPQPELPVGVLADLKFSPDALRLAIGLNSATSPADVWTWNIAEASLVRWTHSEMGGLKPADMVEPSLIRFVSFDRRQIPAWVYRPKAAKEPTPVIIDIHGGPEGQSRPGFSTTYQYWVNALGATVISPNVRGSTGYGKTYLALDNAMKRQDSVRDIGALLDWIASQPDLDKSRVVVSGGSYGGFMTLAALAAYNDRLAGAIDTVGISDFTTFLTHTEGYRRDLRRVEYGDERDPKMKAEFDRISPLNLTDKMTKPLFVIAGFNDPRVPWTEGEQIVAKVRANGGDVWWMMAKDEGHGFRKKQNRDALREAETLFLRKVFGAGS
ncbi:prolyl oligopeptidase family serine peptidase [Phenylobacterium sp. LH3H17]|uniref:S9 family peptidase n=1 Tax=Phenylobacterium sp. LH3H17 TaxID=2903901 RepID=UPI0020C9F47B|nr:prolyl oligopeptidase family serine peptidase [Phenylobacterium sp. LH3H17]UTP39833.1 prolyl oligopeptidase family serine peptidase [Phenylobacterium sp. LH3H17]